MWKSTALVNHEIALHAHCVTHVNLSRATYSFKHVFKTKQKTCEFSTPLYKVQVSKPLKQTVTLQRVHNELKMQK